jgi:hypothetical protein
MAQPLQIEDYEQAKVHVVEDDAVEKFSLARIEHLARTVTLYAWQFVETGRRKVEGKQDIIEGGFKWVRIDTLRQTTARPASGGHIELEGISDAYSRRGILPEEAKLTWRVWPGKGEQPGVIEAREAIPA